MKHVEIDFDKLEEAEAIISHIHNRYRKGLLTVIKVIGLPGMGKSYCCLRLAELITMRIHGKNLMKKEYIADDLLKIIKILRNTKKRGMPLVVEEVSVLFPSRRHMTQENVAAGQIWDTMRKKGMVVIMNCPLSKDVDSKITSLSNLQIETLRVNKKKGVCIIKPLRLQANPSTSKVYYHRLHDKHGMEVHRSFVMKPSDKLCEEYEEMKDSFLDDLYTLLQKKQESKIEKTMDKLINSGIPKITEKEHRRYTRYKKGITPEEQAKLEGCSGSAIYKSLEQYKVKIQKIQKMEKTSTPK